MEVNEDAVAGRTQRLFELGKALSLAAEIKDPDPANHALWNFSAGGYKPGGFFSYILLAIGMADSHNLALLAKIYPAYVAAWRLGAFHTGGIEVLRLIGEGVPATTLAVARALGSEDLL